MNLSLMTCLLAYCLNFDKLFFHFGLISSQDANVEALLDQVLGNLKADTIRSSCYKCPSTPASISSVKMALTAEEMPIEEA